MQFLKACLNYKVLFVIGIIIALAYLFTPQLARYSWILLVLACPASMILMVAAMQHGKGQVYVCAECGLTYTDKNWSQKCQAWCAEHKSCNLEIIKHSIQQSNE